MTCTKSDRYPETCHAVLGHRTPIQDVGDSDRSPANSDFLIICSRKKLKNTSTHNKCSFRVHCASSLKQRACLQDFTLISKDSQKFFVGDGSLHPSTCLHSLPLTETCTCCSPLLGTNPRNLRRTRNRDTEDTQSPTCIRSDIHAFYFLWAGLRTSKQNPFTVPS